MKGTQRIQLHKVKRPHASILWSYDIWSRCAVWGVCAHPWIYIIILFNTAQLQCLAASSKQWGLSTHKLYYDEVITVYFATATWSRILVHVVAMRKKIFVKNIFMYPLVPGLVSWSAVYILYHHSLQVASLKSYCKLCDQLQITATSQSQILGAFVIDYGFKGCHTTALSHWNFLHHSFVSRSPKELVLTVTQSLAVNLPEELEKPVPKKRRRAMQHPAGGSLCMPWFSNILICHSYFLIAQTSAVLFCCVICWSELCNIPHI